jgi:hypothetical protein
MPGCEPGATPGAPGAVTAGEKLLPPVGLMLFSVGDTDAELDGAVVVVVVEVVEGASLPLPPHPASSPIVMIAAPPAATIVRRPKGFELIVNILSLLAPLVVVTVDTGRFGRSRWRQDLRSE